VSEGAEPTDYAGPTYRDAGDAPAAKRDAA
jgi:hypothetical protein